MKEDEIQELAGEVEVTLRQFIHAPDDHAYTVMALWIWHTHLREKDGRFAPQVTPRLYIGSRDPGCGKTRTTETITRMSHNGEMILDPTPPSLHCLMNEELATVGFDEIDLYFGRGGGKTSMRTILNGGYRKGQSITKQVRGVAQRWNIHAPVVMAGLNADLFMRGEQFAALRSRSIPIILERKPKDVYLDRYNEELHNVLLHNIMLRLRRWGKYHTRDVLGIPIEGLMPEDIQDRNEELWTVLFRVAKHLGGNWPERCESAARKYAMDEPGEDEEKPLASPTAELLAAVKCVFEPHEEFLPTFEILDRLNELEDPPAIMNGWVTIRSMTMGLSRSLSIYGIEHVRVQQDHEQAWGYTRKSLRLSPVDVEWEDGNEAA